MKNNYIKLLTEFVSFKTISTDISFQNEMLKAVSWLNRLFKDKGFKVSLIKGKGYNPIIVAKYIVDPKIKTIMIYGHYDVQPASIEDGWKDDPFILKRKGNRFVARGAVDNKGQIMVHITAVFEAIENNTLSSNILFFIEGNEESGNSQLPKIIRENKKLLECDLIVVSDGEMIGTNPTFDVSFRGGGNMRIVYTAHSNDRHSGLYGGAVPNPAFELAKILAKIKPGKKVTLPKVGLFPTIQVSGFISGYTGSGFKNIIPGKAEARLNIRTVHPQNSEKVMREIQEFIIKKTPAYIKVSIEAEVHGDPVLLDTEHDDVVYMKKVLKEVHNKEVVHQYSGGSLPIVAYFKSILRKPIVLIPLCNDDCNMHGVDENFSQYHMNKALEFTRALWNSVK